jgi:zinc/manganese transport system substrate-binding protein
MQRRDAIVARSGARGSLDSPSPHAKREAQSRGSGACPASAHLTFGLSPLAANRATALAASQSAFVDRTKSLHLDVQSCDQDRSLMEGLMKSFAVAAAFVVLASIPVLAAEPVHVVAAENFYGDVAKQIGGPSVRVTSILSNPDQDPHLFEASPSVAKNLSGAQIVIYNGVDYDPWMADLLKATKAPDRKAIVVADLIGKTSGDNPHIWYDPATMVVAARAIKDALVAADPADTAQYEKRLTAFEDSLKPIQDKIADLRKRSVGIPVTATEPVFGYMFEALGMEVRNGAFQLAVMNDTEPSPSQIAAFEDDLKNRKVKLFVYNSQATDPLAERMLKLAKASNIPVVGANETEPPGSNYQAWMTKELVAVDKALSPLTE